MIRRVEIETVKNGYIMYVELRSNNSPKRVVYVYNSIEDVANHLKEMPSGEGEDTSVEYQDDMGLDEPERVGRDIIRENPVRRR